MAASAIATRAKANSLDLEDVDALRAQAERALQQEDLLRRAITSFAVQYEIYRRDARVLADLGRELTAKIEAVSMPTPPGLDRSDIHG